MLRQRLQRLQRSRRRHPPSPIGRARARLFLVPRALVQSRLERPSSRLDPVHLLHREHPPDFRVHVARIAVVSAVAVRIVLVAAARENVDRSIRKQ